MPHPELAEMLWIGVGLENLGTEMERPWPLNQPFQGSRGVRVRLSFSPCCRPLLPKLRNRGQGGSPVARSERG